MSESEENKQLVLDYWRVVYEERDYEKAGTFFHADGRYEDVPIPDGAGVGPAGIAARLRLGHGPVEAFEHEIHRIVAEGDTVMTEHTETWRFHTGEDGSRHQGPFWPKPPLAINSQTFRGELPPPYPPAAKPLGGGIGSGALPENLRCDGTYLFIDNVIVDEWCEDYQNKLDLFRQCIDDAVMF